MCCECEDQEAAVECQNCGEPFCSPCYQMQHRKGKRTAHTAIPVLGEIMAMPAGEKMGLGAGAGAAAGAGGGGASVQNAGAGAGAAEVAAARTGSRAAAEALDGAAQTADAHEAKRATGKSKSGFAASMIPLRLNEEERAMLGVLVGALEVSEYTDEVDTMRYGKHERIQEQFEEMMKFLSGLYVCNNFKQGCQVALQAFAENEAFFQKIFEIGRRHKVMNPEKMRSTYGKMMYMLQDVCGGRHGGRAVGINCLKEIVTVKEFLVNKNATALLNDSRLDDATMVIDSDAGSDAATLGAAKQDAFAYLQQKYASKMISREEIARCIYSMADHESYTQIASSPVAQMIQLLKDNFGKGSASTKGGDLSMRFGQGGSKLNHSHATQYTFVLQTLSFWHLACEKMFGLWFAADADLLSNSDYRLCNTGQGLNRVQNCPNVANTIHRILKSVQSQCGSWVGLSVVHLGDRDVPNSLVFIDKYTQIPRILAPIAHTIGQLDALAADPNTRSYILGTFGSVEKLKMLILSDYFKHGFDGSGSDGGSCIDGRLTSTWNWCSKIEKKSYYRVFQLAGFTTFDGDWRAG